MERGRADRGLIALGAGFVVLALTVLLAFALFQKQQSDTHWVAHTLRVQRQLGQTLTHLQDAESGERGYLLTAREPFLDPYYASIKKLPGDFEALQRLVRDNPKQGAAVARLRAATTTRLAMLASGVQQIRAGALTVAREPERLTQGNALMASIRQQIGALNEEESRLLDERTAEANQASALLTLALGLGAIAVLALGVFAFNAASRRAAALQASNAQLSHEIETRAAAEAQVRQMQKMESLGQLTGGIAHDFNNMLAIIIGSLDLAKRRLGGDLAKVEAGIDAALEGAQRAAQLTGRLLAFSRLQPLSPRILDANKLVSGMSELLRHTVGDTLKIETVLAGGLWTTFADPGQLESAILNLCVNARDAMPEGGHLTLETGNAALDDEYARIHTEVRPGQYVLISVTDTGSGMPPEVLERAFDPFYTTKGVGRGTGLGLSQVHGFVKQSGGHVKIYSEPGVGTTVKLYLPRAQSAGEVGAAAEAPAAEPRAAGQEVVLVVEDEERVRRMTVDGLRELGYVVVHAADAAQALDMLADQPHIDLLFTDIVMPDMNGRKLAEQARGLRPDLRVIYTTGYTRNAIVHNGMLDPGLAFLPKPFTLDQLARKVREVLDEEPATASA